jgi:hypothetical protein
VSNVFARLFDRFRGSGSAAITLPPMDGALRPNTRIDEAEEVAAVAAADNITGGPDSVFLSSGARLLSLSSSKAADVVWTAPSGISCLAAHPSGALAAGLEEGRLVVRGGAHDGLAFTTLGDVPIVSVSAAAFADENTLFVCLASQDHRMADWKVDLMKHGASGSVWKIDLASGAVTCMARKLAFPYGVVAGENGDVIVSESWRHRLLRISPEGRVEVIVDELPGYPARLARGGEDRDLWLCIFAPRTQLIEFVLREDEYRRRMMDTIDPEYWIAPSLHHPRSYLEPMQGGSLKQLGELKPWSPSRSLGIVVRLDSNGHPVESLHSRANGVRHGVTSCLPAEGGLLMTCKGGDVVVRAKI